jgi:glycosyltransferase involved in cell wall biosynthesis
MEYKMIRNRDIVITGLQPWDIEIGSNCKNIAIELSRYNRVLYVNRALDRASALRNRKDAKVEKRRRSISGVENDLNQQSSNLWVLDPRTVLESINWLPFPSLFDYFNRINNKRLAKEINKAMKTLGFKQSLLFIDNDFFRALHLPELLTDISASIYYLRDKLTSQPYFKKHGERLEPQLIKNVTMVAANSSYLANYARQYNEQAFDIGQGCDFTWIHQPEDKKPEKISGIKRPLIGYVGALTAARLDIELLIRIAENRPEWSLVLVGPEDEVFSTSRLHQLSNVYFTGSKPVEVLPAYISSFDVCINPQLVNEMTIGNYPRKIDEYLVLGKPVVATNTEAMQLFAAYVYLCSNAAEYISQISTALQESDNNSERNERKEFAMSHTWENSVSIMCTHLESVLSESNKNM